MCGIAGFARTDGGTLQGSVDDVLEAMALALRPRGPDDMQLLRRPEVAMSFTRLSLVDPAGGRQPFVSRDGAVILAANGEVYNHRELRRELGEDLFSSHSDCEVLLHLYRRDGIRFLDRVRGMIGVAVIDLERKQLLLARDRLGLKPLFVHRTADDQILFGSEVKALFQHPACPRELDWAGSLAEQGLNAAPIMPYGPPRDWFLGIDQVEPATIQQIDLRTGATEVHRYWTMPTPLDASDVDPEELVEQTRELLAESVGECLVADAEVGLLLSGGIDSAGIAALSGDRLEHTFSALTPSTVLNGDYDLAHETARTLGLTHHEFAFGLDDHPSTDEWLRLVWLMESPLCGPEQFLKSELYRGVRGLRPDMKAVLLGSGADEMSGGYTRMLAGGGGWDDFLANVGDMSRRRALASPDAAMGVWWEGGRRLVSDHAVDALAASALDDPYDEFVRWKIRDWQQYNFWVEDRTASGNAVEARVPYLDHRIVEVFASVPRAYRSTLFWDKQIIRRALADVLPPEVANRPKIAFYEGDGVRYTHQMFARMLLADGGALLDRSFQSPRAAQYLRRDDIRAAVADTAAGRSSVHLELTLRLVNLGLLDGMLDQNPATRLSAAPAPVEIRPEEREAARSTVFADVAARPETVLRLADEVLLLDEVGGSQAFVAVDGEIRFVIDHDDDAAWYGVLSRVDGTRSLQDLCDEAGVRFDDVTELVEQSVLLGLLVDGSPPDREPVGAGTVSTGVAP